MKMDVVNHEPKPWNKFIWNLLLNIEQRHKTMIWLSFEILGNNVMWEGSQKWKDIAIEVEKVLKRQEDNFATLKEE